jgi:hypothetical protein
MPTLYTTIGTQEEIEPKNNEFFTLNEIKQLVGGHFEIITRTEDNKLVIGNEAGKIKMLPINVLASARIDIELYGNIIICDGRYLD